MFYLNVKRTVVSRSGHIFHSITSNVWTDALVFDYDYFIDIYRHLLGNHGSWRLLRKTLTRDQQSQDSLQV